jgi:hypothetical protein
MIPLKRESAIEKEVVTYAQNHGWIVYKFSSPGRRGVPDRLFISSVGHHVFVEFKRPGEKPVALQYREIERINRQGGTAGWFDNAADAIAFLNENLAPTPAAKADDTVRMRPRHSHAHVWNRTGQDKSNP